MFDFIIATKSRIRANVGRGIIRLMLRYAQTQDLAEREAILGAIALLLDIEFQLEKG